MPTYGYRCEKCGDEFDVWQRMSDEAGAACPVCGSSSRRLFYPAGIVFKGSGFYKTDSRSASGSSSGSGSGSESTAPSTSTANGTGADTATKKSDSPKPDSPKPAAGSGSASKGD